MGRMLLLLVLGMGIIGTYSALQLNSSNLNANENAVEDYELNQARNLARGGIEYAISQLAQDSTWNSGFSSSSQSNGDLVVSIEKTGAMFPDGPDVGLDNAKLVTSTATYLGISHTVQAVIQITASESIPPALRYALLTNGDLALTGNLNVHDDNNTSWNADIHTNSAMKLKGNNTVTGYGTYFSGVESSPSKNADNTFLPNVNMGSPFHHTAPKVALPEINPTKWASIATKVITGNPTISGNQVLGTKENPEIWYFTGNVHISGTITGYGVFLVKGNLFLTGNCTLNTVDPSGNTLGIIVGGDTEVHGNVSVGANILTKGNYLSTGNCTVTGSIVAGGESVMKGNVEIRYRPPLAKLTSKVWAGDPERPAIVSYYE
ncbi:MAG: hypothetical protein WBQ23_13325 [Bacteroidota bacterium]